jgi:hypothetical protein
MQEGETKRLVVTHCERADFEAFYRFLNPATSPEARLTEESAPQVLLLADYYQVEWLKRRCVRHLTKQISSKDDVQLPLLLLARSLGLDDLYRCCVEKYARVTLDAKERWAADLSELQGLSETEIISDVLRYARKLERSESTEAACKGAFMARSVQCFEGLSLGEPLRTRCGPMIEAERCMEVVHYA